MPLDRSAGAVFENLEQNHTLQEVLLPDTGKALTVICPFEDPLGLHFESTWDWDDNDNWAVNCLFCEELDHITQGTAQFDHGCYDTGDRDIEDP